MRALPTRGLARHRDRAASRTVHPVPMLLRLPQHPDDAYTLTLPRRLRLPLLACRKASAADRYVPPEFRV